MSDISTWLKENGLEKYADAFVRNDIGLDVLSDLDREDLKDLGVSLGDAKRLRRAITALESAPQGEFGGRGQLSSPAGTEAERRQLTVMFCDLVGSTELSQTLDPEELSEVNRLYQDAAKLSIEGSGGYVARYMGDGVLAYFGYPLAHEDDAERAVRAGLHLTDAIPQLRTAPRLAVRVGIATGPVVVGDLIGEGASQESAVVGETPNLAARLQGAAAANCVTISSATYTLIAGLFDCEDLGMHRLKGFALEQQLWRVTQEKFVESRFEALRNQQLSSFVGRDGEVRLLTDRWQSAIAGEGQVVLIEGEAGIGKSRLTDELRSFVTSSNHTLIRYQCSPHSTNSAFYPFIAQLEHASAIAASDGPEERLDKLERLLPHATPKRKRTSWLFAKLLGLPVERYQLPDLDPQEIKAQTIQAFRRQLGVLVHRATLLVVFEDAHWMDPSSLELLSVLLQDGQTLPVLFVVTHRPEFKSPWDAYGFVTKLQLNRLPRRDGMAIITSVANGKTLPDEVVQQILARTDGVALFVEELTKTVLESGLFREEAGRYVLDEELPDLAIPSTLRDSLVARLDRLGGAKKVAQTAACIGREFTFALLQPVTQLAAGELSAALKTLAANELIYGRGTSPASSYTFKHALVQDAAYQSLLLKTRKQIHYRIAQVLEQQFAKTVESQPDLLAQHCAKADQFARAVTYWQAAGDGACSRNANQEAVRCFEQALAALVKLPRSDDNDRATLDLRFGLRNALFALGELQQVRDALGNSEELAAGLDDAYRLGQAIYYLAHVSWSVGDYGSALANGNRVFKLNDATQAAAQQFRSGGLLIQTHHSLGNYSQAIALACDSTKKMTESQERQRDGTVTLSGVLSRTWMVWSLLELGQFAEAKAGAMKALQIAEEVGQPFSLVVALWGAARVASFAGDQGESLAVLERAVELCRRWDIQLLYPSTAASLGHVYALSNRFDEAMPLLKEGTRKSASMAGAAGHSRGIRLFAEACLLAGHTDEALGYAQQSLELTRERGERGDGAWALHTLGEVCLASDKMDADAAESYFKQSSQLADELGMRPLIAMCHLGFGALYGQTQREPDGQERLRQAAALFDTLGMKPPGRADKWLERAWGANKR